MKCSIVIPLYNKRAYIARCLQSVFAQTHTDFDLVVVDDGSTDGGEHELDACADDRLRLIVQANQGVSVARNTGVEAARHDIVFFLDADDTWEPTFLEAMARLVQTHPSAGVYACGTRKVFADGHAATCTLQASAFVGETALLANYFQTFVDLGQSPFSNSSFGVRKETFYRAGRYTPGVKLTEDSDLWVRLCLASDMAFDPQPLANYFVETDNNTRVQAQTSDYEVIKTLARALNEGQVPQPQQRAARKLLALQKHAQIKRLILLGRNGAAWTRLLDRDIWASRPQGSFFLVLAASAPQGVLRRIRQLRTAAR